MFSTISPQQVSFFIILIVSFLLLLTERLRNDIVAVLIIISLYSTGVLSSHEALSGFGSEPAIVLAGIFVLTSALSHTGLSEKIGDLIGRFSGRSYSGSLGVIMPAVGFMSAFTHHVTTTAMMLPVVLNMSRDRGLPASKLLMPLSFAASLGTTITIIGAPAFLIASSTLQQAGRPGLGIFSITPIGVALTIAGTLFTLFIGRFLLPVRQGGADLNERFRLEEYYTEIEILPTSRFLSKTVEEVEADTRYNFRVAGIVRNKRHKKPPLGKHVLEAGDILLVRTSPEEILAIREEAGLELHPIARYGEETDLSANGHLEGADKLVQVVISPGSDLIRRTIGDIDFLERFGAIVVGLWRRDGWLQRKLAKTRLRAGDVLVLQGDEESLSKVSSDPAFLMMVPFQGEVQLRRKAPLAGMIMLGTIFLAALNILPLEMAMLTGAVAVLLTRCITPGQAYRAIDGRIYVFIAGAIPLGLAMQKTGASKLIASWLEYGVRGWSQTFILFAIFSVVAILTQLMSDAATTALFAPVALALANALGHAPEPYVITVAMSAVASFLTPIGHHGNLLIYGPGGYRFSDFVRVGAPLTVIVAIVVVFLSQLLWS